MSKLSVHLVGDRIRALRGTLPPPVKWFVYAISLSCALSVGLYLLRVGASGSYRYWYLIWNLLLACVPLVLSIWLAYRLRTQRWLRWENIALTVGWLVFLPNSFYLMTDLIHLTATGEINILFDAVMFGSFIFNAYVAGYLSVLFVHRRLERSIGEGKSMLAILGVFLLCGVAIYMGRVLRWNSWDLVMNPAGVLFDVSEGVVNPLAAAQMIFVTSLFTLCISVVYMVVWTGIRVVRTSAGSAKPMRRARTKRRPQSDMRNSG